MEQPVAYLHADKLERTSGELDKPHYPGFQRMEIKLQNL